MRAALFWLGLPAVDSNGLLLTLPHVQLKAFKEDPESRAPGLALEVRTAANMHTCGSVAMLLGGVCGPSMVAAAGQPGKCRVLIVCEVSSTIQPLCADLPLPLGVCAGAAPRGPGGREGGEGCMLCQVYAVHTVYCPALPPLHSLHCIAQGLLSA